MRQEMMGFWDVSGISLTICKQSAPRSRQTTKPTTIFTGWMLSLMPKQKCQSTLGNLPIHCQYLTKFIKTDQIFTE